MMNIENYQLFLKVETNPLNIDRSVDHVFETNNISVAKILVFFDNNLFKGELCIENPNEKSKSTENISYEQRKMYISTITKFLSVTEAIQTGTFSIRYPFYDYEIIKKGPIDHLNCKISEKDVYIILSCPYIFMKLYKSQEFDICSEIKFTNAEHELNQLVYMQTLNCAMFPEGNQDRTKDYRLSIDFFDTPIDKYNPLSTLDCARRSMMNPIEYQEYKIYDENQLTRTIKFLKIYVTLQALCENFELLKGVESMIQYDPSRFASLKDKIDSYIELNHSKEFKQNKLSFFIQSKDCEQPKLIIIYKNIIANEDTDLYFCILNEYKLMDIYCDTLDHSQMIILECISTHRSRNYKCLKEENNNDIKQPKFYFSSCNFSMSNRSTINLIPNSRFRFWDSTKVPFESLNIPKRIIYANFPKNEDEDSNSLESEQESDQDMSLPRRNIVTPSYPSNLNEESFILADE